MFEKNSPEKASYVKGGHLWLVVIKGLRNFLVGNYKERKIESIRKASET